MKWISVKVQLPVDFREVVIWCTARSGDWYWMASYDSEDKCWYDYENERMENITHWMIPEKP